MRKIKKGKKLWSAMFVLFAVFALVISFRMPVQAAENVTNIDMNTANDLWNITQSWDSINRGTNLSALDVSGLSVKTQNGAFVYVEAPGILAYPDTTSMIKATYQNIGTIGGRSVSVQVFFQSFHGTKDTDPNCGLNGNAALKPYLDPERSAVVLSTCFWGGFSQHAIHGMEEDYHFYFTDTGEAISCKGAYMTANSLNEGESIRYMTEGQDGGNLNTFVRSDHLLRQREFGWWEGTSDAFTDNPLADDYTRASVCFKLCTDDPKFMMWSDTNDFWHAYTVAPLGATLPTEPEKVGFDKAGATVDSISDVNIGDLLCFDVMQKVETIGITGSIRYQTFELVDILPPELTFDSANVTDEYGTLLNDSQVKITVNNGTVTAAMTDSFLRNGMRYAGETYHLHVAARVNEKAAASSGFQNQGRSIVNGTSANTKMVKISAGKPGLTIQKSAEKHEYQVGDEAVYHIKVSQTKQGAVATNVVITDTSLPEGMAISDAGDAISVNSPSAYTLERKGNGFVVKIPSLPFGQVDIKVKCKVEQSVSGKEITNTATLEADGTDRQEAKAKVQINSPKLAIEKSVSKYEWRVGNTVDYTIKVEQTADGCVAKNVKISDLSLPEGLAVSSGTGAVTVNYPKTWIDTDGTPHQTEAKTVRQGRGFAVTLDGLEYNAPVTVKVKCTVTEAVNGNVVFNTAVAEAENVENPAKDNAKVYINSPGVHILKECDKAYAKPGDLISYTLHVDNWKQGTLARNIVISDQIESENMKLQKNSIVLLDSNGNPIKDAKISVEGNTFRIETGRKLVCPDKNYQIIDAENGNANGGKLNPEGITTEKSFSVEYQVVATKQVEEGGALKNKATVSCDEGTKDENEAVIGVNEPLLDMVKTSDKSAYQPGETGHYTLTIRQMRESLTAKSVTVTDAFKESGMKIDTDSISLELNGEAIAPQSIVVNEQKTGFTIKTGKDLKDTDKLVVSYDVRFTSIVQGEYYTNYAVAKGSNTQEAEDKNKILADRGEIPVLIVNKEAEKDQVRVGDKNRYTIVVTQDRHYVEAENVVIQDSFDKEGAEYVKKSFKITDKRGQDITEDVKILYSDNGFTINTGKNLGYDEYFKITYTVSYADDSLGGQIITNTAEAGSDNTESVIAAAQVEVKPDAPELQVKKTAEKDSVRVGDRNTYKITVKQTKEGETAKNITICDQLSDAGMSYLKKSLRVKDAEGKDITKDVTISFEENGFTIKTEENLFYNETITVTYDVIYGSKELAGKSVKNTAVAKADNGDDKGTNGEYTVDIIQDTPELQVKKKAEKDSVRVGDRNTYKITVKQTKEGEIAKNITICDTLSEPGISYVRKSLMVKDDDGKDITKEVDISFEENGFTIRTEEDLSYNEMITVTYDVTYDSKELAGKSVKNTVVAKADNGGDNGTKGEHTIDVIPDTPEFQVKKTAEKNAVRIGDRNTYKITVKQTKEGETAKKVMICDRLSESGISYVKDSISVKDKDGKDITKEADISFEENGFTIKTKENLSYNEMLTVTYDVTYDSKELSGKSVKNTVVVKADNGGDNGTNGEYTVDIIQDTPEFQVKKTAEKKSVRVGDKNTYRIVVKQTKKGETAKNVVIRDVLSEGASYVKNSFVITDKNGKKLSGVSGKFENNGFTINTGKNLEFNEAFILTYQVTYDDASAGQEIKNSVDITADNGSGETSADTTVKVMEVKNKVKSGHAPQTGLKDNILAYVLGGTALITAGIAGVVHFLRKKKKK
ncbi:MAG: isopeptide-forming domain-containing fimbrial protein [Lachnospiraceae bacterium]|nr:isopeptide-forming domain-containing fimbrial protein [Lachnospiraceae bacterium]